MGSSESSEKKATQTEIKIHLDRTCQQAGSAIKGKVSLVMGQAQGSLFKKFNQGGVLSIRLVGEEKIFWAPGYEHDPQAPKAVKHLVDGNSRRESNRLIINVEQQLRQLKFNKLTTDDIKVTVPFSIPLPDDLPPSFYYCGAMMSCLQVKYRLTAMMIGLKGGAAVNYSQTPQSQLVIQDSQLLFVRELDPIGMQPVAVRAEGQVSGTFGLFGIYITAIVPSVYSSYIYI